MGPKNHPMERKIILTKKKLHNFRFQPLILPGCIPTCFCLLWFHLPNPFCCDSLLEKNVLQGKDYHFVVALGGEESVIRLLQTKGLEATKKKWVVTLPETNSSPLKMEGWKNAISFWDDLFWGSMLVLGGVSLYRSCSFSFKGGKPVFFSVNQPRADFLDFLQLATKKPQTPQLYGSMFLPIFWGLQL